MLFFKDLVKKISVSPDKKTKQKDYLQKGLLPIVDQGQELVGGYTDDMSMEVKCNLPVIVFGDHTRAVKYIDFPFGAGADGIKVLQPKEGVFPKYLYYATQYLVLRLEDRGYARHYQYIEKKEIDVPDYKEQERIVARIEELFSQLDSGVETLKKTKEQLAVYRQAVLMEAFEAASTNHVAHSKIDDLLTTERKGMTTGPFGTLIKKNEHRSTGVPMLGIENIGEGFFVDGNRIFVTEEKAKELQSFVVKEGDIIISRSGTVGEICVVPKRAEGALLSTNLIRVSLNPDIVSSNYFVYLFRSKGVVLDQVKELCKGSTRMFLNQTILKQIQFPVPTIKVQKQIVELIEARLSVCESIEKTVDTALQQAEAVRQSILKKAFEGEY